MSISKHIKEHSMLGITTADGVRHISVGANGDYATIAEAFTAIDVEIAAQTKLVTGTYTANTGYDITEASSNPITSDSGRVWFDHPTQTGNPRVVCNVISSQGTLLPVGGFVDSSLTFSSQSIDVYELVIYEVVLEGGTVHSTGTHAIIPTGVVLKGQAGATLDSSGILFFLTTGYAELHNLSDFEFGSSSAAEPFGVLRCFNVNDYTTIAAWSPLYSLEITGGQTNLTGVKTTVPSGFSGFTRDMIYRLPVVGDLSNNPVVIPANLGGTFKFKNCTIEAVVNDDIIAAITTFNLIRINVGASARVARLYFDACRFLIRDSQNAVTATFNVFSFIGSSAKAHEIVFDNSQLEWDDGTSTITKNLCATKPAAAIVYSGTNKNFAGDTMDVTTNITALSTVTF